MTSSHRKSTSILTAFVLLSCCLFPAAAIRSLSYIERIDALSRLNSRQHFSEIQYANAAIVNRFLVTMMQTLTEQRVLEAGRTSNGMENIAEAFVNADAVQMTVSGLCLNHTREVIFGLIKKDYWALQSFYGKTNLDAFRIDEVVQLVNDIRQAWHKDFYEQDEAKKEEYGRKLVEEDLPRYFGFLQRLLQENGTGVFVGEELTLADLAAYDVAFQMKKVKNFDAPAKFPELQTLKTKVEENPNLKKYLESRKDTPL